MNHIEIIRIRLHNLSDNDQVTIFFQQFKEKLGKLRNQNMMIALLRNTKIENDWSIHLTSLKDSACREVSYMALIIAETFRAIGIVNHDIWKPVFPKKYEENNRKDIDS